METTVLDDNMRMLVEEQVDQILRNRMGSPFTLDDKDTLDKHESQIQSMLADSSLGRALNGPLWLSGASVVDGTITADKISVNTLEAVTTNTGTLNVTGTITAATAYPATGARVEINSTGLAGYSGAVTTTFKLNTDGSGEIGTGSNKISWTTGGVVTIPSALISSLTIAEIGTGTFGGTYSSGGSNPRFQISSTQFVAYDSGGNETFKLLASTGAVTATGSFTIKSASSGARVSLSNAGGIEGYNSGSTRTFYVNAATGAGQMGAGTNSLSWDSSGNVSIGGVALSSGKITASALSVSTLSAISANLGTITAGSITGGTITASAITTGTLAADRLSGGTLAGGFTVSTASGPIVFNSAGTPDDVIQFKYSGTAKGQVYTTNTTFVVQYASGGGLTMTSSSITMSQSSSSISVASNIPAMFGATDVHINLGDAGGIYRLKVRDSLGTEVFGVTSDGDLVRPITNDSTALGAYYGRVPIYINGSPKYLGVYS